MMMQVLWLAAVSLCLLGAALSLPFEDEFNKGQRLVVDHILHRYKTDPTYAKLYDQWVKEQNEPLNETFPCPHLPPSKRVPTSVHKLRPGDIKVVGAVGDSLTAGRGASLGVVGLLLDFPELSWSIGGAKSYQEHRTLPNILRQYNPNVYGAAKCREKRVLNKAKSGAKSDFLIDEIKQLVQAMKDDPKINFKKDWKVITVFIGGNDLCAICKDYDMWSPENYIKRVREGLDYLQENVPRTFVNLVEILNVEMMRELSNNLLCDAVHVYACNCIANPKSKEALEKVLEYRNQYQELTKKLAESGRYDKKKDFTVVLQPFYRDTYPPYKKDGSIDMSYFASDCFHESKKGQEAAAKALWNNMVEDVNSKRLDWHPNERLECPSEKSPYLFTYKNSRP